MEISVKLLSVCVFLCIVKINGQQNHLNVTQFGAVGDGTTDDSQAFLKAWAGLCGISEGNATLVIPQGFTYLLQPIVFQGPCKTNSVQIQILGNIISPGAPSSWSQTSHNSWISFLGVDGLVIAGTGSINGQGQFWWKPKEELNSDDSDSAAGSSPTALLISGCNNVQLSDITSINSPRNHIQITKCNEVTMWNLSIIAPSNSPNTDGIDVTNSNDIKISNSFIGTGDDCIAIKEFTSNVNITQVTCGPGHGISVGSLGNDGQNQTAENIHVQNCTFNGTQNGARVKTWPGGLGYAKSIRFQDIILINANNSVIIDQNYCNGSHDCPTKDTAVKISDVTFSGFSGTTIKQQAITLNCDSNTNCTDIVLENIHITSAIPELVLQTFCKNVTGTSIDTIPSVPCFSSNSTQ